MNVNQSTSTQSARDRLLLTRRSLLAAAAGTGVAVAVTTIGASPAYSFTAHVAEVEVDPETGFVEVKTIWVMSATGSTPSRTLP